MGERIRQLEEALTFLQSSLSAEVHPLLRSDLLRIKSSAELHRAQTGSKTASSFTTDEHQNETSTPLPSHYSTLEQPHDRVGSMRQVSCLPLKKFFPSPFSARDLMMSTGLIIAVLRMVSHLNATTVLNIQSFLPT